MGDEWGESLRSRWAEQRFPELALAGKDSDGRKRGGGVANRTDTCSCRDKLRRRSVRCRGSMWARDSHGSWQRGVRLGRAIKTGLKKLNKEKCRVHFWLLIREMNNERVALKSLPESQEKVSGFVWLQKGRERDWSQRRVARSLLVHSSVNS